MNNGRMGLKFLMALAVAAAMPALAAPPVNDAFSNRITIVSSPTVVTTSLAQATFDSFNFDYSPASPEWWEITYNYHNELPVTGSLWWKVAPTNPCSVTMEFMNAPPGDSAERLDVWFHDWRPDGGLIGHGWIAAINSFTGKVPFVTVRASCATNFDVQLTGNASSVVLRFTTHTAPLFIVAPQSRTVSPGDSVFFGVVATGHSALQYQWLHNGEAMPGETFPILSMDHLSATNAGTYRVVVTDDLGTNAAEATLVVSETDVPPRWLKLEAVASNEWRGVLAGEAVRSYRIDGSTNLIDWVPVTRVAQESSVKYGTADGYTIDLGVSMVSTSGIAFLPSTNSEVRFTTTSPGAFFRAVRYDPPLSECANYLKVLRFAKELVAYSFRYDNGPYGFEASAAAQDSFLNSNISPLVKTLRHECPQHGLYVLHIYGRQPFCTLHTLLEPSW